MSLKIQAFSELHKPTLALLLWAGSYSVADTFADSAFPMAFQMPTFERQRQSERDLTSQLPSWLVIIQLALRLTE
jgi:hypothetical protein